MDTLCWKQDKPHYTHTHIHTRFESFYHLGHLSPFESKSLPMGNVRQSWITNFYNAKGRVYSIPAVASGELNGRSSYGCASSSSFDLASIAQSVCEKAFILLESLLWRHNEHDSVSNHQPRGCLLNRLFRRRSKKTSKLRVTGLCVGNSPKPVNSPHKGPVTRKMFPFDDVIMWNDNWHRFVWQICCWITHHCLLNSLFLDNTKENFKACIAGPMWGESSGDRWIPLTKGQWRGMYFHDMTSWWYKASFSARRRLAAESDILREKLDIRQDIVRTL